MMFTKLVYANILIILAGQISFFFHLVKTKRNEYYSYILRYIIYALACYLAGGASGIVLYLIFASNIIMQCFNIKSHQIVKLVFTIGCCYLYVYSEDYTLINNLPYIVLFTQMWIKPYVRDKFKSFLKRFEDVLIIIYAYNIKLYILALYELYKLCFKIVIKYFKKYISFVNKRIN